MTNLRQRLEQLTPQQRQLLTQRLQEQSSGAQISSQGEGRQTLVAYVVPQTTAAEQSIEALEGADLRQALQAKLPDHMVPATFISLPALPRNANGKVDLKALPSPETITSPVSSNQTAHLAQPRTPNEQILADIWAEVLCLDELSIQDNFFELGGDSILSIQIVSMAREAGLSLMPNQLFECPTVEALAAAVTTTADEAIAPIEQGEIVGEIPLTPIQHWFFERSLIAPHHWHQARLFQLPANIALATVEAAIAQLWNHHDALRLRFSHDGQAWTQTSEPADGVVPFRHIDLAALDEVGQLQAIVEQADGDRQALNLAANPLIQVVYATRGKAQPAWLLLNLHHLIVDGVSWQILQQDLASLLTDPDKPLPAKTSAYKAWAEALITDCPAKQSEAAFWFNQVETPALQLISPPPAESLEANAHTVTVSLDVAKTQQLLQEVPAAYNTQINDVLLTALAQAVFESQGFTGTTLRCDLEVHGREVLTEELDLSRTVGWLTTFYPVLLQLQPTDDAITNLKSIKEQLRQIPERGIGYGMLRYLGPADTQTRLAAAGSSQLLFNYLGQQTGPARDPVSNHLTPVSGIALGQLRNPKNSRSHRLEINAWIENGQLQLHWTYDRQLQTEADIISLANRYLQALSHLITQCTTTESGGFTPSDFPDADLDQGELDDFLSQLTL